MDDMGIMPLRKSVLLYLIAPIALLFGHIAITMTVTLELTTA